MANRWLREALSDAEKVAKRMKHGELTTAHLFVGLVQQNSGSVRNVIIRNMRISLNRIHETVQLVGNTAVGVLPGGSVHYTQAVKDALALAEARANELRHPDGATREDVMVALLMQKDDRFIDMLHYLKLDRYELMKKFAPDLVEA